MSTLNQELRDSLLMCAAALQAACLPGHPLSEKDTVTAGDGSYMTIRQILDTADAALEMPQAFPPAAQAVPNDDIGHEWITRHNLFVYEVDFGEDGKGRYIRLNDFNQVCEKLEHAANEWADAATNGVQYLKNVRDGISSIDSAIAWLTRDIEHARGEQPTAAAPTGEVES